MFPEKITNQISVEQKNAKAETYSGTAEEQTAKSTEISTENETADTEVPHGYAYETLTAEQKTVYDEVYRIILAHDSKVKVSTCDEKSFREGISFCDSRSWGHFLGIRL